MRNCVGEKDEEEHKCTKIWFICQECQHEKSHSEKMVEKQKKNRCQIDEWMDVHPSVMVLLLMSIICQNVYVLFFTETVY